MQRIYNLDNWENEEDFLSELAKKKGRLLKGGEPDIKTTAKLVLIDWQRGEIPFFVPPPKEVMDLEEDENEGFEAPKIKIKRDK